MKKLTIMFDTNMDYAGDALLHCFATEEESNKASQDTAFLHWYREKSQIDINHQFPEFSLYEVCVYSSLEEWKNVYARNYEEEIRRSALNKLTDEEKRVLGLLDSTKKVVTKKKK